MGRGEARIHGSLSALSAGGMAAKWRGRGEAGQRPGRGGAGTVQDGIQGGMHDDWPEDRALAQAAAAVEALRTALDGEPLSAEAPVPGPLPDSRRARALHALALLGGVASARAIARQLEDLGDAGLDARAVREALRGAELRRLGGGYLALPGAVDPDLEPWLRGRLRRLGPRGVDDLVVDVLARWPHGDAAAVRSWLYQDPPGVAVVDGVARLVPGWEDRGGRG